MIAHTGACIVLSRLPSERNGLRRAFASCDSRTRSAPAEQLALVGPIFTCRRAAAAGRRHVLRLPVVVRARVEKSCAARQSSSADMVSLLWCCKRLQDKNPAVCGGVSNSRSCSSDGLHLLHFRTEVAQQVLDAVPQRRRRAGAARAGAAHVQIDDAVAEAREGDVAAVLRHRRAHARLQQLLDGRDDSPRPSDRRTPSPVVVVRGLARRPARPTCSAP